MEKPTILRGSFCGVLYWIFHTTEGARVRWILYCDWPVYSKFHNRASSGPTSKAGQLLVLQHTPVPSRQDRDNPVWDRDSAWSLFLNPWPLREFCLFILRSSFETCLMLCFPSSTTAFCPAENIWSALKCSLWKGEVTCCHAFGVFEHCWRCRLWGIRSTRIDWFLCVIFHCHLLHVAQSASKACGAPWELEDGNLGISSQYLCFSVDWLGNSLARIPVSVTGYWRENELCNTNFGCHDFFEFFEFFELGYQGTDSLGGVEQGGH